MSGSPGEDKNAPISLSIPEKITLLSVRRNVKDLDRLLAYSCVAELMLAERVSTFDLVGQKKTCGPKLHGVYIFNKRETGDEVVDDILHQLIKLMSTDKNADKKSMNEIMKDIDATKIFPKICTTLATKGLLKIKKGVFSSKYELLDESYEEQLRNEFKKIATIVDNRGKDDVNCALTPSVYALFSLIACNGGSLKREVLDDRDITEATMEMSSQIEKRTDGLVTLVLFQRIYHLLDEFKN
jgi:hypothetical protein